MPAYTPPNTLSDTTRRLCCAPYVDAEFGNAVIQEVVESERKAVPPSFGFDLDPVVRHCLRARRLIIIRHAVVTALLVVGLCLNAPATILWLSLCAAIVAMRSSAVRQLPRAVRLGMVASLAFVGLCFAGYAVAGVLLGRLLSSAGLGDPSFGDYEPDTPSRDLEELLTAGAQGVSQIAPLVLAGGMFLALFLSRRHGFGILASELAPGVRASAPATSNPRVEWRLGVVSAMQGGNVAVHDIDPFAGAGWVRHSWSFAVTLKPPREDDEARARAERVAIDVPALNRRAAEAVIALRDPGLSANERIPNVYVVPYVAADGNRRNDDPLIDPQTRTPRTMASAETIAAIEACPQGGLRHYLRAVIPANGKDIRTPDGRLVLPAQDSGVGVTAFIHLAVEGGMLYTEFVATVMPQIRAAYHLVDNLRPERVHSQAAAHTLRYFIRDNVLGPVHLVRNCWDALRLTSRMSRSARQSDEYRFYDYGAQFSVRELAAQRPTLKFMQTLDEEKYIKLLDKAVTEAVLDFLAESGVDTTEFRNQVQNTRITIGSLTAFGGVQNFGGRNTVTQNSMPSKPMGGARA